MAAQILNIAEDMLIQKLISGQAPVTTKTKLLLAVYILAIVLIMAGMGFLGYAGYLQLLKTYSYEAATAITGLSIIALGLAFALAGYLISAYTKFRIRMMRKELTDVSADLLSIVEHDLNQKVQDNPKSALLISSIAGFILADKIL